jgi:hypothetical protein
MANITSPKTLNKLKKNITYMTVNIQEDALQLQSVHFSWNNGFSIISYTTGMKN